MRSNLPGSLGIGGTRRGRRSLRLIRTVPPPEMSQIGEMLPPTWDSGLYRAFQAATICRTVSSRLWVMSHAGKCARILRKSE